MLGLRLLGSDTVLGSLFERLLYRESAAVEIDVPPAKGQQFSPARAGPERERGQHIERAAAQLPQQFLGFGGLEDFDLCVSLLRRLDHVGGIVAQQAPGLRFLESAVGDNVDVPDCRRRQSYPISLEAVQELGDADSRRIDRIAVLRLGDQLGAFDLCFALRVYALERMPTALAFAGGILGLDDDAPVTG